MEAEKEVWEGRNFGIQGFGEGSVTDLAMTARPFGTEIKRNLRIKQHSTRYASIRQLIFSC